MAALSGEKVLLTGPAGQIAFPLARELARDNEVWGLARFGNPEDRAKVEKVGLRTVSVDLADPDFSEVPDDFDVVLFHDFDFYLGRGRDFVIFAECLERCARFG